MEQRRQVLRIGTAAIALAAALRLLSAGFFNPVVALVDKPDIFSLFMYMETGCFVRFSGTAVFQPQATEKPTEPATEPSLPQAPTVTFSARDLDLVKVQYHCSHRPNLEELLTKPLAWNLQDKEPAVLILHTHATETYTGEDIDYSGYYRSLNEQQNMLAIGAEIAQVLEEGGIHVLHDTTLHDYPNYNGSYDNSRKTIQKYLEDYPTIRMVLDIHRDASATNTGQFATSATVGGEKSAQLMMVVGTKVAGWEENLALGLKLTALLEQENPGICRPIDLRTERFNMDLSPGGMLVEVGAAGNTQQEALVAARALAQSILQLAGGSE